MQAPSKQSILEAYSELVRKNAGKPIGCGIFARETGISQYYWRGGYWRSWSAFQADAGFVPNSRTEKIPDEVLLNHYALLAVELGGIPTQADLQLKRRTTPSFPDKAAFKRFGGREEIINQLIEYCRNKAQFASLFQSLTENSSKSLDQRLKSFGVSGFVYLLRSGRKYKIGRTNASGRRLRELSIQLPEKPDMLHVIETDDPEGIERYWHDRFADKRQGGEWFALSTEDIRAFKKRRFQ